MIIKGFEELNIDTKYIIKSTVIFYEYSNTKKIMYSICVSEFSSKTYIIFVKKPCIISMYLNSHKKYI